MRTPPPISADELERPSGELPPIADDPIAGYVKPEPTDAPGLPIGPDEVALFLSGCGDAAAFVTRHEHWRVEPSEVALPSAAIARQLAKPDTAFAAWLAAHADAVLIVVGLGIVVVPRMMVEWQWIRYNREVAARAAAGLSSEVPVGYGSAASEPLGDGGAFAGGADGGVRGDGVEGGADHRPTDPESLAAAVGGVIGR